MTPPATVAHVITRLDLGGAQQNTLYTVSHLDPKRFRCLLVAGEGGLLDGETRDLGRREGFEVSLHPALRRALSPARDLLAFLQLLSLFLRVRPQIVHTHSSKAGILGRLAARLAGVPVVVHTYHGFGFHDYQAPSIRALYIAAERLACRAADALVFVSAANREYARANSLGRPESYRLIRSGIKLADYPAPVADAGKKKKSLGLGMHKPLVTSVGNLKPQKNPADFINMAKLVHEGLPETSFLFVGEGPLRKRLEVQAFTSDLGGRLSFPGWRRDVPEILAVSDIFVLTSLWEGLPRALVEAMSSGVPPVCYATDGVKDLVQDGVNGFLVPPGNITALAKRVSELLKDAELRRRLGDAARRSIGPEFDIDRMVAQQETLYAELLAGRT